VLGGVLLLATVAAAAAPLDVSIDAYRSAAQDGRVGTVLGHVVEDPRHPLDKPQPVGDVAVTIVPRSAALLQRFADVKRRAHEAEKDYRRSGPELVAARRALERALTEAGAGELVRYVVAGPDGLFEVGNLPAGDWVLIAERRRLVTKNSTSANRRELDVFARTPRLTGYWVITVWLKELPVPPGATESLELNDRNVWMTAIEERRSDPNR
jgi:hypothetical protein